jgi:hypothetical protein
LMKKWAILPEIPSCILFFCLRFKSLRFKVEPKTGHYFFTELYTSVRVFY